MCSLMTQGGPFIMYMHIKYTLNILNHIISIILNKADIKQKRKWSRLASLKNMFPRSDFLIKLQLEKCVVFKPYS